MGKEENGNFSSVSFRLRINEVGKAAAEMETFQAERD